MQKLSTRVTDTAIQYGGTFSRMSDYSANVCLIECSGRFFRSL